MDFACLVFSCHVKKVHTLHTIFVNCVFKVNGTFEYNCHLGKCDFIQTEESLRYFSILQQTIFPFLLPGIITIISYISLWFYISKNHKTLKSNDSRFVLIFNIATYYDNPKS